MGLILKLGEISLSTVGAPIESGFRQMPGTAFILYAAKNAASLGIIEHVPATSPFVFLRPVPGYTHPNPNTLLTDVRAVVENGAIRYLVIAYLGSSTAITTPTINNAQFRVWGPPANNPAPTSLACGTNSITGCKTCGSGSTMDMNKCEVCADGQGKFKF